MDLQRILNNVAPCGLHCGHCLSNPDSPIAGLARRLRDQLGGFAKAAPRFAGYDPVFEDYGAFQRILDRFADQGGCRGCRFGGACLFGACKVPACIREHGVDFCFQCAQFPCDGHGLPPMLAGIWAERNTMMRDQGLEAFSRWLDNLPRY